MNSDWQFSLLDEWAYSEVSPGDFFALVFGGREVVVSVGSTGDKPGFCQALAASDVSGFVSDKSTAYISPASFFAKVPKASLADEVLAFVVDLDDVEDAGLNNLVRDIDAAPAKPTHIVSSGNGYHLYYVLSEPVQWRIRWREKISAVSDAIFDYWDQHAPGCVADAACRSIPHGFRPVGSLSKDRGRRCRCWQVRGSSRASIYDIAQSLDVPLFYADGSPIDFSRVDDVSHERHYQWQLLRLGDEGISHRNRGLYDFTLRQIPLKTKKGHRFLSMFCLSGLGYACGVPIDEVERDLHALVRDNWRSMRDPVRESEIPAALKGYCYDYATVRKETREEWLGWRYGASQKRNYGAQHKTRSEHIASVNRKRSMSAQIAIADYLSSNPGAKKGEVAVAVGLCRQTVYKYWERARLLSGGI